MTTQTIHSLVIEDDPDDIMLLKDALAEVGLGKLKLECADRLSRGLIQLGGGNYDVVLLDLNLPDSRGLDTLNTVIKSYPRLPVVVLSGLADDAITVESVRRGAQDYLVKGEISGPLVLRVIRYAIERKQVEAVLRASEARYRTLVETSPNGIFLADLEGKLLLCNQQAARLHGYSTPEAMVGMDIFKLIDPADRRLAAINTQKTINEGHVTHAEYNLLRRDGTRFPGEISTALARSTSGAASGFINMTRDISERKKAVETEKQLVKVEQEFIAAISQELTAPLSSLVEYMDLARKRLKNNGSIEDELLSHAAQDVRQLNNTVDELSDFALLENDGLTLSLSQVDICQMIEEVLGSLSEQAGASQVALMAGATRGSLVAEVDKRRIRRVINKLVKNAIKMSNKGGRVLVTCKPMNGHLVVNVIDEGPGMAREEYERIFDKYYQASRSNDGKVGLGLYVSRQVVEAHGGTLVVSSQKGAGSTFTLHLPVMQKK